MGNCPEGGCDKIKDIDKAVFGEHQDGLTYKIEKKADQKCLHKYIKKPHISITVLLLATFITIVGSSIMTGYKFFFDQEIVPYVYASSKRVDDVEKKADKNDKEIGIIKEQIHRIDETTGQTKVEVGNINEKIDRQNYRIKEQFEKQYEQMKILIESIKK